MYDGDKPIACANFKGYDDRSAEIKKVWVVEDYRGKHISKKMMTLIEERAKENGFGQAILQTREACIEAVALYKSIGYMKIENYPPYDEMEFAACYGKQL